MATINSEANAWYPNAKWQLSYTIGNSSSGKTKVTYSIKSVGQSSTTILASYCKLKVKDGLGNKLIDFTYGNPDGDPDGKGVRGQEVSFKDNTHKTDSFQVTHDSNGVGKFTVSFSVQTYPRTEVDGPLESSETVLIPELSYSYTRCTSPTSVTVTSEIIKPGGNATISWEGAQSGQGGNNISKYRVYWKASASGDSPTLSDKYQDFASSASSGSISIPENEVTRGHIIKFAVQALGSVPNYDANSITQGDNSVKINNKPSKPQNGSVTPRIIPTEGGAVTFTVSPGTDSDGQTIGLKYANSASGERISCSSPLTLELTTAGTYYFWSNDGLEDSEEYITVSVSINTKPTITVKVAGTTQQTVNILNGATYVLDPTITLINGNDGQLYNNTYNYYLHYRPYDSSSWTEKILWEKDESTTKIIDDIRSYGYFTELDSKGYYYYFSATRNDGLENSERAGTYETGLCYVSRHPRLIGMYNTQNYSNLSDQNFDGYFSQALSFTFEKDSGYNSLKIYNGDNELITIPLIFSEDGLRGQWIGNDLTKGSYTFYGKIGHAGNEYYSAKKNLGSSYKIENLEAKNLTARADFQVYETEQTYEFSIYNTFNVNYNELTKEKFREYGISDIENSFYAKLSINGTEGGRQALTIAEKGSNSNQYTSNDTIYFNLTADQLYEMLPSVSDKNRTYTANLIVGFEDVFGTNIETSKPYVVNYGAVPEVSNVSIKVGKVEESESEEAIDAWGNLKELSSWSYLKETMPLTIGGAVASYNTGSKIQVMINRIRNGIESGYVNFGEPIDLIQNATPSHSTLTPGNPIVYEFFNLPIITIGEIVDLEYEVNFKLKVITDADTAYHYSGRELYPNNIKVCGHSSQGVVELSSVDFSSAQITRSDSKLKYKYINTHPGAPAPNKDNNNYSLGLVAELQYKNISSSDYSTDNLKEIGINNFGDFLLYSGKDKEINFVFPENMDAFVCRLRITTIQTVTNGSESYTTEKIVYSNEQAVYNTLPTVSYRKNLLGINATNLYDNNVKNAVLVIGEHSSKNIIYFLSSTGTKTVNTSTGDIDGFIIDCGTW